MLKGITLRWIRNNIGMTLFLIVFIVVVSAVSIRNYYYNNVENLLTLHATGACASFSGVQAGDADRFHARAQSVVAEYDEKHLMELMVIDAEGETYLTSSAFKSGEEGGTADFLLAREAEDGTGVWTGKLPQTGEKVMAVTSVIYDTNQRLVGGVRLMTSLEKVDTRILVFVLILVSLGLVMLFFAIVSGTYFINTIVIPVNEITQTARRISRGDYNIRIDKHYDDEIGDLCDTINDLAGELTAADQMKNDFISTVSHELRTPLTAIKGWGETMMSAPDDKELMQKGMNVILGETDRLSQMVEELLDFSRLQSGRLTMHMEKTDLLAELQEAVLMYEQRVRQEGKTLTLEEPPEGTAFTVMADPRRLRQVFVNVIDNAVKYTDKGGHISVRTAIENNHIQVIVTDDGCGISMSDLGRVKEKFYKGNFTRRGSGIGLAICDEVIRQHNGILALESEEGRGTRVTIAVPLTQGAAPPAGPDEAPPASPPAS